MEHGSLTDPSQSTFSLLYNPRTKFCGYSIPHPSDNRVNIRIQTTGDAAKDVFNDSCQDLMVICQHVRSTFDKAVVDFRMSKSVNGMDIDSNN
ncbi:hypothetical protein PRUPE_2G047700 [Prunus persica]|uniref:DNA-directed RNA polymerase RBP11-like dimerisation domain-containing protein n=1 Tax=Prunus persica TaxID=3760 RepID=A0A251QEE2_PRUPE|nr:hypothetical protein PRUPE_2G047700 [Prunus persica]